MSVDAFVLAGGASVRMGTDKAKVVWGGRPMALVVAATVAEVCERVAIVRRTAENWPLDVIVDPEHEGTHPLFGVAAALAAATTQLVLVVPCDVPRLQAASVRSLIGAGGPVIAYGGGRRHPLIGVYPRWWAAEALEAAREGRSVTSFASTCGQVAIPPEELVNVNSPSDLGGITGP